jgi:hypothetical protein
MDIPHRGPQWFESIRQQAIALRGNDRNLFTTHFDANMSHRTAWVERFGVSWINDQIHFANWNAAKIAGIPSVRVNDWAKANGVQITRNYQRVDREGGLMALDGGLPGIARDQLMVLPPNEWEKYRPELVYENWAEKTLAAEQESVRR